MWTFEKNFQLNLNQFESRCLGMEPFIKAETIAMKAIGLHSELSGAHDC